MNPSPRQLTFLLAAAVTAGPLAMQIYLPVLPAVSQQFGAGAALTQLTFSGFVFAMGVSQLVFGTVSDRYGRRPMMLTGLGIFIAGSIGCALATDIHQLIAARVVQAIGGGAGVVLARAVLSDLYAPTEMARQLAFVIMMMMIGPTLGPLVGGIIAGVTDWRGIFWFVAIAGLLVWLLLQRFLPETLQPREHDARPRLIDGIAAALKQPRFIGYAAVTTFSVSAFYVFISVVPYLMVEMFRRPPELFGVYFLFLASAYAVGNFLATRFGGRLGIRRSVLAGSSVAFLGGGVMIACAVALKPQPLTLFLPMMLVVFSQGFSNPSAQSGAVAQVPGFAGSASSLVSFGMQIIGAGIAQAVAGAPQNTVMPLVWTLAALLAAAFAVTAATTLTGDRRRP